ncbi:MAG: methyltransferase domain-containing protein [Kordiimonadaceae bacterium]|jgi:NADH dehydrogenase [ubiquinone] 1 alpha subcomplex assembly factor 5|nr:methyltransferase domain-containing protein [Kordiimonadaceae bacterium]MBT6033302.1 methyltransferase domain-containing protein [Kordiimonadaceae bacterium]
MTETTSDKKLQFKGPLKEVEIFNRPLIKKRRDRIASEFRKHDFINQEITNRLIDNVQDIKRNFNIILNMNCDERSMHTHFENVFVINQDLSYKMVSRYEGLKIQADEELFPFQNQSLELILSCLNLHWVNDLPGALAQLLHGLKPDGLFLGALFGGETLTELRQSMLKADMDHRGGISPHISPFVDVRDAGSLMQRAGFTLPVVSTERITVTYSDAFALMKELKGMGENNALMKGYKALSSPKLMMKVAENYHLSFANEQGRIPVTFDIIYLQGWAPHESQQKPLKPGSGKMFLKDALGQKPPKSDKLS